MLVVLRGSLIALLLVLGACSSVERSSSGADATPAPAARPVTASPEQAQATLDDGRHFGYIKAVDPSSDSLVFDLAEFLTDDDADRAAAEDGVIQPGEHVDNDYYIRNKNTKLRTISYGAEVGVRVVNWPDCCESIDGDIEAFAAAFRPGGETDLYHGPSSQYWLTVSDGRILEIEEQYLP